jgi:hypothetical protein
VVVASSTTPCSLRGGGGALWSAPPPASTTTQSTGTARIDPILAAGRPQHYATRVSSGRAWRTRRLAAASFASACARRVSGVAPSSGKTAKPIDALMP